MENLLDWSVRDRQQYFFSLQGVLRIIEIILVIVSLILLRHGGSDEAGWNLILKLNASFIISVIYINVGTTMFLTITLLIFLVSTLLGHQPPVLLDSMTTMIGGILMITAGALSLSYGVMGPDDGALFLSYQVSVRV